MDANPATNLNDQLKPETNQPEQVEKQAQIVHKKQKKGKGKKQPEEEKSFEQDGTQNEQKMSKSELRKI